MPSKIDALPDCPFWALRETASYTGLCEQIISRAVRSGALKAARVGGVYRIRRADVDAWLAAQAVQPAQSESAPKPRKPTPSTAPRRLDW